MSTSGNNELTKIQVLEHRSRSHQIFLTVFALIFGLNSNGIDTQLNELLLVIALCYLVTIYQNLFAELKFVTDVKFLQMLSKKITLIIPISIIISLLRIRYVDIKGIWYVLSILSLYIFCVFVMHYIYDKKKQEVIKKVERWKK